LDRLSDAYLFDALRDPAAVPPTPIDHAQRFIERLSGAAKPRIPALALAKKLEITGEGLVGAALLYDGGLCTWPHSVTKTIRTTANSRLERMALW